MPTGGTLGVLIGATLGGTIGQTFGGHIGLTSMLFEHIGMFCPSTQEQTQFAFDTFEISKTANNTNDNFFMFFFFF